MIQVPPIPSDEPSGGWRDELSLGYAPLDRVHREFAELIAALGAAEGAEVAPALAAVLAHCRSHFGDEEAWMAETGFPAGECHAAEHAAVLASIEGVSRRVAAGELEPARTLATALAEWFPPHSQHLDSALAHWLCHRRLGGRPVVLRGRLGERLAGAPAAMEPTTC
jgi:hemerythrin